jgi:hypothetical protein
LAEESLDRSGRLKRNLSSSILEAEFSKRLCLDLLDEEFVNQAKLMATVYAAIASFENTVREFIKKRLLEEIGENWWENGVSKTIRDKAESRRDEESKIRWHTPRGEDLINYTEFGDLTSIISQNWSSFEAYVESQDWVRQLIKTIEKSRNVIMHSGVLGKEDIERIGTLVRDWIRQVGA